VQIISHCFYSYWVITLPSMAASLSLGQLRSDGAALREILPRVEHRQHRYLNHRAENSHPPTRQRERRMQRFKSPGHAQRFLAAYKPIAQHFRPGCHRFSAPTYRQEMLQRFQMRREITDLTIAA
jgi:putative transposase